MAFKKRSYGRKELPAAIEPWGTGDHQDKTEVQFTGKTDQSEAGSAWRLEVSKVEALKQDEGDKEGQDEIEDGSGLMFKTMIQRPMGGEGVKEVIFNVPAIVTNLPELTTGELSERQSGGPPPMMIFDGFSPLPGDPFPLGESLMGMKDAQGPLHAFGGSEAFRIPESGPSSRLVPKARFHASKQTLSILQ